MEAPATVAAAPPVRPTDMHEALGISVPYASQILNDKREPPVELALRIHARYGLKFGKLKTASPADIAALRRVYEIRVEDHGSEPRPAAAAPSATNAPQIIRSEADSGEPREADSAEGVGASMPRMEADSRRPFLPSSATCSPTSGRPPSSSASPACSKAGDPL